MSARRLHDAAFLEHLRHTHADTNGVRKMRNALVREGIAIDREQTARLLRAAGLSGKRKGGAPVTACKPKGPNIRPALVGREFKAAGPNRLREPDITIRDLRPEMRLGFATP